MKRALSLIGLSIIFVLSPGQVIAGERQTSDAPSAKERTTASKLGRFGAPPNRQSGGGRSTDSAQSMIALVPGSPLSATTPSQSYLVRTASEPLAVWVYIPQEYQSAPGAELVLLDETGAIPLQISPVNLVSTSEATIIRLPIDYPLEPDQVYRWQFTVTVNPDDINGNHTVGGLIETVAPTGDLARQIEQAQPANLDQIYTQHDIWHDALTRLGESRMADPHNETLKASWTNLLASVGLGELADVPLGTCCQTPL